MKKAIKKRILILIGIMCCIFAAAGFVACDNGGETENKLIFEVDAETEIGYYEYCEVPTLVIKDTAGNVYFPVCVVKAPDGTEIEVEEGKFFVLRDGNYTFEYTVVFDGQTIKKTTVAKVVDRIAPEFVTDVSDITIFKGDSVAIPEVAYRDNKDAKEDLTFSVRVTREGEEVNVVNNAFVAESDGVYEIAYSISDKAGNANKLIVTATALKKTDGEIAYFYENGCINLCDIERCFSTEFVVSDEANYPLSENGFSLKITETGGYDYSGVKLGSPKLTDISDYNYFYIDVYNPQAEPVSFWINRIYDVPYINLAPKKWTRVVAVKNGDNFDMTKYSGKISDTGDGSCDIFYPGEIEGVPNPTAKNITGINVGMDGANNKILYLGQLRAVNELPELPQGIAYATAVKAELKISSTVRVGSTHKVEYELQDAENAELSVTVSVNGGEKKEVKVNSDFTFDKEGLYAFTATLTRGGEVIGKSEKTIKCFDPKGRIADFTDKDVVKSNGLKPYVSHDVYTTDQTYGYNAESVTGVAGADNSLAGLSISSPDISDVSAYKYIYIDVYAVDCDISFAVNYQYYSPFVTVKQGEWKRIVLKNDNNGDFIMLNKDGNVGTAAGDKVFNGYTGEYGENHRTDDITGIKLVAMTDAGWRHILIGAFVACDELPELPENVTYANYFTDIGDNADVVEGEGIIWRKDW